MKKPNEFSPQITWRGQTVMKNRPMSKKNFSSRLYKDENAIQAKLTQVRYISRELHRGSGGARGGEEGIFLLTELI